VKIKLPPSPLVGEGWGEGKQHLFHLHPHLNPLLCLWQTSIEGEDIKSFMKNFNITRGHFALQLR